RRHTRFSRDWSSDVCSSDLFPAILQTSSDIDTILDSELAQSALRIGAVILIGLITIWLLQRVISPLVRVAIREQMAGEPEIEVRSEERRVGKGGRCRGKT